MARRRRGFARVLSRDERGATLIEYTILVGRMAATVILAVCFVGEWVSDKGDSMDPTLAASRGELPGRSEGEGRAEGWK